MSVLWVEAGVMSVAAGVSDAELLQRLTAVRGIGPWTVDMVSYDMCVQLGSHCCFSAGRGPQQTCICAGMRRAAVPTVAAGG
jgi:hypothetical protein